MSQVPNAAFEKWYLLLSAAGILLSVAALAAGNSAFLLVTLGMVFVGLGEFINHPYREAWIGDPRYPGAAKISGHPRRNRPHGIAFLGTGGVLMLIGIAKIIIS